MKAVDVVARGLLGVFALVVARKAMRAAAYVRRQRQGPRNLLQRYPGWAVVTGASSGIGLEFTTQLAEAGYNCVITARREERLEQLAEQLRAKHGVKVIVLAADVSGFGVDGKHSKEYAARVEAAIKAAGDPEPRIGLLVCNAGISELARHFTDVCVERNLAMMHLNSGGTVATTQALMPMLIRGGPRRAAVITLGALNSVVPLPGFAVSSGTKAFIRYFTMAAGSEFADHIDFMCAHPLGVASEILKLPADGKRIISASEFARGSLAQLGYCTETAAVWRHEMLNWYADNLASRERFAKRWLTQIPAFGTYLQRQTRCDIAVEQKIEMEPFASSSA